MNTRPSTVRWRIMAILILASFVSYVLRGNLSIAPQSMMLDLGLSEVQWGWVMAAFPAGYALFQFPGGVFADKFGPRRALMLIAIAWAVLTVLMVVTMTLSDVLNNTATTIVAAPVGIQMANALQVSPDPFLMAVAVAASAAFLTPIGHKNNTLILGPGGYRFGDYWRMGLPLEILIIAVSIPTILVVWPL